MRLETLRNTDILCTENEYLKKNKNKKITNTFI